MIKPRVSKKVPHHKGIKGHAGHAPPAHRVPGSYIGRGFVAKALAGKK